jgi:DNA-binding LytR/AlgR family response regulator
MEKINCIIVDDEPLAVELVAGYVKKTPFLELKGKCLSAFDAIQLLGREKIDLIFLDIQMPDLNGIDFSKTISPGIKVIFTTAFKDYAFEGFKADAIDYLLKPFNYPEFLKAANKAKDLIELKSKTKTSAQHDNFIFVRSEYKQVKIDLNEVYYFEGLKDYVKIWLVSQPKPVLTLMSLKTLEEELPEENFMRVHRSFIVALNKINSIERSQIIINNERITVADQYKTRFQEFIDNKSFN